MKLPISVLSGLCIAALLTACAETKPPQFYLLSPIPNPKVETVGATPAATVTLAVGPVEMPKHVDRSQIVKFSSANKLELSEFDRWAEPLANNFARVLGENLVVLVPTEQVLIHPWRRTPPFDFQITVNVLTFAVRPNGYVELIARWSVFSKKGTEPVMSRRSSYSVEVGGDGFEATVAAMSRAVADLSQDIASTIKSLPTAP